MRCMRYVQTTYTASLVAYQILARNRASSVNVVTDQSRQDYRANTSIAAFSIRDLMYTTV